MHKTPPYDVAKDLTPIINVAVSPYALVVHPSLPARDLKEFIAYAKANPGKLSYSSAGSAALAPRRRTPKTMAGIDIVHVPNKGMNPAAHRSHGRPGPGVVRQRARHALKQRPERLRPIAMAERKRSALLPDLPTIDERGLQGIEVGNWAGLLAPAGLDPRS